MPAALLTDSGLDAVRAVTAAAGALVLAWDWWRSRRGAPRTGRSLRDGLLLGLGLFAALCWWNLLAFHFGNYVHVWDVYHYYVGAKYFPELGYRRLYLCTAVADAEDGALDLVTGRRVRNLEDNLLVPVDRLLREQDPRCAARFTRERWAAFKHDVAWFRSRMSPQRWRESQLDHGYNASPAWAIAGSLLAGTGPASTRQILLLTLIDPLLLVTMWALVAWTFGWEVMCVGLIFWGTSIPSKFYWGGGGFLRQDWLVLTVAALCFFRRGLPGLAGFSLAAAALVRVFPALLFIGLLLPAVTQALRAHRVSLPDEARRAVAGAGLALLLLVPVGALVAGGWHAWTSFVENAIKHASTPLTNHMGLKTVIAYDHDSRAELSAPLGLEQDPFGVWKAARNRTFQERRHLYWAAVLVGLGLLGVAADRRAPWTAATLGVGTIALLGELTCYYYSVFLAYAFLWPHRRLVGVALCALASLSAVIALSTGWADVRYTLISLAFVIFVVLATAAFALGPRGVHQPSTSWR